MLVAWNQQWWEYILIPISPKMQLLNTYWDDTKISFIIPVSSSSCSSLKGSSDYKNIAFFKIGNLSMFYTAKYLLTTWPRNSTPKYLHRQLYIQSNSVIFNTVKKCQTILQNIYTTYYSYQQCVSSSCSTQSPTFLLDFSFMYASEWEMMEHCNCNLHYFGDQKYWLFFHEFIGYLYILFCEVFIQFCPYLLYYIASLLLICKILLYIVDIYSDYK